MQTFFIFLSRAPRSFLHAPFAGELADVFEKNEKKNKTTSVYRLGRTWRWLKWIANVVFENLLAETVSQSLYLLLRFGWKTDKKLWFCYSHVPFQVP